MGTYIMDGTVYRRYTKYVWIVHNLGWIPVINPREAFKVVRFSISPRESLWMVRLTLIQEYIYTMDEFVWA